MSDQARVAFSSQFPFALETEFVLQSDRLFVQSGPIMSGMVLLVDLASPESLQFRPEIDQASVFQPQVVRAPSPFQCSCDSHLVHAVGKAVNPMTRSTEWFWQISQTGGKTLGFS